MAWGMQGSFFELVLPGGLLVSIIWIVGFLCLLVGVPFSYFLDNLPSCSDTPTKETS